MTNPIGNGALRHETCKHAMLTEAYAGPDLRPTLLPLCLWKPAAPYPPAMDRAWGGLVEYDRDCAMCMAYER